MTTFNWRNVVLNKTSYTVKSGGQQLNLRRCYLRAEGTPVVLVTGVGCNSDVFWPQDQPSGLAPYLASCGFDVYIAELRGKGLSWPQVSRRSNWGIHELVTEDIPAHLAKIDKLRPSAPQFWVGHGTGSLLLTACYARSDCLAAPLLGMAHFAAARRCELSDLSKSLGYMWWRMKLLVASGLFGHSSFQQATGDSRRLIKEVSAWQHSPHWVDPVDGFDYRTALRQKGLPASSYFSLRESVLWGGVKDTRLWLEELGHHDAQLHCLGKRGGNTRNYNLLTLLTHADACTDHFLEFKQWLEGKNQTALP